MSDYKARPRWVKIGWTTTNFQYDYLQWCGIIGFQFQWCYYVRPGRYPACTQFMELESVLPFVKQAIGKYHDLEIKAFASSARCREEWPNRKVTELWIKVARRSRP